jgi:chemotaxis protein MotB
MRHRHRRRHNPEPDNLDRWLVSYADFITLLFAFFVVMYAISSLNEGKYKVLSDALVTAFKSDPVTQGVGRVAVVDPNLTGVRPIKRQIAQRELERQKKAEQMKDIAQEILQVMSPLVQQGIVSVIETDRGITVEINDSLLFSPGQAALAPAAVVAMRSVAAVVGQTEFPVTIEGHTDNIPISTSQFPSNWELSAVRATTVLRLFVDSGVAPGRLTAIGYGDQRPVADNAGAEGRARNRRVSIQIEAAVPTLPAAGPRPPA